MYNSCFCGKCESMKRSSGFAMFWDGPQGRVNMHIYICQHWVVTGDHGTLLKDFFGIWIFFEFGFAMFSGRSAGSNMHMSTLGRRGWPWLTFPILQEIFLSTE